MKTMIIFFSLMVLCLHGCKSETAICMADPGYICLKMDPNSSQTFMTALLPQLDAMDKQARELMSQHEWLKRRLDICIKQLEEKKGLEPIPLSTKYPLSLKGYPNNVNEYTPKDEPLFIPYESPDVIPLGEPDNIHILRSLLNLRILSLNLYMADANDRIDNFEKRLKRLEEHLNK